MDLVTCLGFVAEIVQNDGNDSPWKIGFNFVGGLVPVTFMTVFLWPMVRAYEKVRSTNKWTINRFETFFQ